MVHPMASQDLWAKTNLSPLLPPKFHKQPGRPKKTRISLAGEPSPSFNPKAKHLTRYNLEIKCSICKQPGHNKRKCPRVNEVGSSSQVRSQRQKKTTHQVKTSTQRITRQSRQKQQILIQQQAPPDTGRITIEINNGISNPRMDIINSTM
ncbi:unnamed protein product [Prunus armeniaca]